MRFYVLGSLQVDEQDKAIALGGYQQRAVLALLLLNAGRPVPIDRIASEIWPNQSLEGVRDSLYVYVSRLRKALGRDRIARTPGGYRLDLTDADEIDAVVFETAVKRASRLLSSDPDAATDLLDSGRLLITPHTAWISRESRQRLVNGLTNNLQAFLAGTPANRVA